MKVSVDRKVLASVLSAVSRAAPLRSALPVLSCVLLDAEGSRLRCQCTDLDLSLTQEVAAEVGKPGRACVPAKLLGELVHSLAGDRVELATATTKGGSHSLALRCASHRSSLQGSDPDDWPAVPEGPETPDVTVGAADLHQALAQVVCAAADDDSRPALAGVLFEADGALLHLAAADGYRLAVRHLALATPAASAWSAIVPKRSVVALARILVDQEQGVGLRLDRTKEGDPTGVVFAVGACTLRTRLIKARFPDYRQVVPTGRETRASFDVAALARAARTTSLYARASSNIMCLDLTPGEPGQMVVSARASDVGETSDTIGCSVEGKPIRIGFDVRYVADALAAIPTAAAFLDLSSPSRPGVFCPAGAEDYVHVVMPMRVEEKPAAKAEEKAKKQETVA